MRRLSLTVLPCLLLLSLTLGAAGQASPRGADVAFDRLAVLQRGVNLSGWLGGTGDFSEQHFETYITPADLKLIHDAGLQDVRLGVSPEALTMHGLHSPQSQAFLARIDKALDEIAAAHLAVQITLFPNDEYKHKIDTTQKGVDDYVFLWRFLAHHFAGRDPQTTFFELMNEPEVQDPYRWMGIQATVIAAIRQSDTQHTIIATAAHYSGLDDLLKVEPVREGNVIYNFHFYEPYPFTHQGATWGSSEWNYYHEIPYPATPETLKAALATVPDLSARYVLFLYGAAGWDEQTMLARLSFARTWAEENHVPLLCNEFGAFRDTAPPDSRARFIHDVRSNLEALHIGWAMWDYSGNFGMVTHEGARIVPDPAVFTALGLAVPR